MRVVHLATTDFGGAFKATMRISESMREQGVESSVLVRSCCYNTKAVEMMDTPVKRIVSKIRNGCNLLFSHGEVVSDLFGADVSRMPQIVEADVVILHWVNSFISAGSIKKLARIRKPIIWVMHDMWAFTGGCHYDQYCGKYEFGCGACPFLKSKNEYDRSYKNMQKKMRLFAETDITFVALSDWQLSCARKSKALAGKNIIKISNPLDISTFRPMDRDRLRREKINISQKIILFGADKALENKNKGFLYLVKALKRLNHEKYCAVCFGKAPEKNRIIDNDMKIIYLGTVQEEEELARWYNIADVFVAPSMQESFGYTVCEALSCGTPVVAFAVGGILDQVQHMENGYLARMEDAEDLANGIEYCVKNRDKLTRNAREGVLQKNRYDIVGMKYFNLCKDEIRTNENS